MNRPERSTLSIDYHPDAEERIERVRFDNPKVFSSRTLMDMVYYQISAMNPKGITLVKNGRIDYRDHQSFANLKSMPSVYRQEYVRELANEMLFAEAIIFEAST